jgi:outer membrane protein OmpA-like peptidoglycan-associated protein
MSEASMRRTRLALLCSVTLISCSSPPKAPTVDESRKHPVNSAAVVELQVCRSELHNTRLAASESARAADAAASAASVQWQAAQQLLSERMPRPDEHRNLSLTVLFPFNGTEFELPEAEATRLLAEAQSSPLIVLRGRTDGTNDTPAEARIARERAQAVEQFLVRSGIPPARIRATWQATGDHAADNDTPEGRALNRRVEIEIYRVAPKALADKSASQS